MSCAGLRRVRWSGWLRSIEVEPDLSDDTSGTLARARELWRRLGRRNIFVKIPATEAGIPAIEAAIADGINVNVTLMFSVEVYRRVAQAYIAGPATAAGRPARMSGAWHRSPASS